jgi:NADP-dependent 3-hydroxy acid dehydrogenase YdfG
MRNKVMLISGAGSGMGQMMARNALDAGWSVAALDVNETGLAQLGDNANLLVSRVDVTKSDEVNDAVTECESRFGPITRLVHAAAIMPLGELAMQEGNLIRRIMDVNYGGLVNLVSAVIPGMKARNGGEIVSFASMAGHWPLLYMGAYAASKHAIVAYTEVLYEELRNTGVRVVCVCPPVVKTPLLDQADATVRPKMFDVFPAITPEQVLAKIEHVLPGKALWVFPGPFTPMSYRLRRWIPRAVWWLVHRIEGR